MSLFPQTIEASLSGSTVSMSYLVWLNFVSEDVRLWAGFGDLDSGGHTWRGIGELGSFSGLEQAVSGEAPETTVSLDLQSSFNTRLARDEFKDEADGRSILVYVQFRDTDRNVKLDDPYAIWSGQMRTPKFEITSGGLTRLTVNLESVFSKRARPNHSLYTDTDQKRRFAGDRGFEFVGSLQNKVVTWPDF